MSTEHEEHEEDEYETRVWLVRTIGVGLAATIAVAFAFVIGVLPPGGGSDDSDDGQLALASDTERATGAASDAGADTDEPVASAVPPNTSTDRDELVEQGADTDAADGDDSDPDAQADGPDTTEPAAAASPTTARGTETNTDTNTDTDEPGIGGPSYPVLPDGSPVPVLGIYDGALITLSGVLPSEEAADRLRTLALAFSKVPDADVANLMTVDATVPQNVGVRVIEMNSARFPEGTPNITPEHAAELDRVALLMTTLPQVTTVVIGHADQRGDSVENFALSADRARAALDYIASQGVDPTRLSARGAGESDLLTLNNDDAALALNRRTEFVISGLFVDPPPADDTPPAEE